MSRVGEGSNKNDPRQVEADAFTEKIDMVRERNASVAAAKGFEGPARAGLFARIRRTLSGGQAAPAAADPEPSEAEVWERERQRRLEYEQDRSTDQ
ncbi:MAG TPA: hypothetical protein VFP55_04580 [Solirubrobacteraceae bacterium]|nr:hypothetical protein [Solirubrobacteraceae bacterium]